MFNNLYAAANEIRTLLMPFAFVLCVIGIGEMGWRAGSDPRAVLGALIKTIIIVALIAAYPDDDERPGRKRSSTYAGSLPTPAMPSSSNSFARTSRISRPIR